MNLETGLVPIREPKQIFLSLRKAYLSKREMRKADSQERPVMFFNTWGKTEAFATIQEAMAMLAKDKGLPKSTQTWINGRYMLLAEAIELADDLKPDCYKRAGWSAPTHKVQFWTEAAAAKFGLAFGTKGKAKTRPAGKKTKSARKARY